MGWVGKEGRNVIPPVEQERKKEKKVVEEPAELVQNPPKFLEFHPMRIFEGHKVAPQHFKQTLQLQNTI